MTKRPCEVCGAPIPADKENFSNSISCPMQQPHAEHVKFCHICDHWCDRTDSICSTLCPTHVVVRH